MALRIHHLNCGTMCPHGAPFINGHGGLLDPGHMVCHCLLIESNDGLVLVDTGMGVEDVRRPAERLGRAFMGLVRPTADYRETALVQVKQLGFKPEDVRHIVVTHLDLDHAGGIGDFPQATVHLYEPEYQAAMHPTFREKQRYKQHHWAHRPQWATYREEGESWQGFECIRAIPGLEEEILLVPLVGHTRGHSGVAVKSGDGCLLHCGDASFHHNQMAHEPSCPPGLDLFQRVMAVNNQDRLHNLHRLHELAQRSVGEVQLFSAHDALELARYQ